MNNLSNFYTSLVKSYVCIRPITTSLRDYLYYVHCHQHDSDCVQINKNESKLSAKNSEGNTCSWKVDKLVNESENNIMDLSEDEERITKLVSEGHDAACLFVEVGGDYVTFKKKQEQKKRIIDKLDSYIQSTVDTSNTNELTLSIEYAYFGFTDTYSYDMRRDVLCPSDDLINKGIDHWMKKIDSLKDIWKLVSRGSKISSVLKIRLNQANSLLNRHASLYIFDLHLLENKSKDEHYQNGIYYSFTSLRSIIERALGNTNDELKSEKIITNYYVLTHLLAPFACGHNELIILTYIQECLHTFRDETIMVLELVEMMRGIRILSLVNNSSINHERNSVHHLQKKLSVYKVREQYICHKMKCSYQIFKQNKFEMAQSVISSVYI
ncbi:MAG: hypothetical protein EXX96DRAFT_233946 [Benjaminiella poitrasii]|nr:MAG: hypothetical protein EXX96DRAFT_233946 [Benjaminiella poitrasii]